MASYHCKRICKYFLQISEEKYIFKYIKHYFQRNIFRNCSYLHVQGTQTSQKPSFSSLLAVNLNALILLSFLLLPLFHNRSYYWLFDVWLFLLLFKRNGEIGLKVCEQNGREHCKMPRWRTLICSPLYVILMHTLLLLFKTSCREQTRPKRHSDRSNEVGEGSGKRKREWKVWKMKTKKW